MLVLTYIAIIAFKIKIGNHCVQSFSAELRYSSLGKLCDANESSNKLSSCLKNTMLPIAETSYGEFQIEVRGSAIPNNLFKEIEVCSVPSIQLGNNERSSQSVVESPISNRIQKEKRRRSMKSIKLKKRAAVSIPDITSKSRISAAYEKESMLTRDEEQNLSCAIRALNKAISIRNELSLSKGDSLSAVNISDLEWANACGVTVNQLMRIMVEGKEARSLLVAKNAGLVVQISKRYGVRRGSSNSLTFQDMIQEGNLGLMEAAERFDPSKGFKFCTYAAYWIRQRIKKSIADNSRLIRLPVHVHTMVGKIDRAKKGMTAKLGRTPSPKELAEELEISIDKVKFYTESSRSVLSLENQINVNGSNYKDNVRLTLCDKIACTELPSPESDVETDHLRQEIRAAIDQLNEIERNIVVLRYGLDDGSPRTIDYTAAHLGISRERTRLIEARAINKLRHPGRNYKLKDYVEDNNMSNEDCYEENSFVQYNELQTPEQIWSL